MRCSRIFAFTIICIVQCFAATVFGQTNSLAPQIALQEQKLAQARTSNDKRAEATELNALANLYWQSGQLQKGMEYCKQALELEQNSGFRTGEAFTKDIMARIYTDMGQDQKALDLLNEILPFWQSSSNRRRARFVHEEQFFDVGLAFTLSNLGRVYNQLGDQQKALDYIHQALPIWLKSGSARGQANALEIIGRTYADMGQGQNALDSFNRALPLWREDGDEGGEALTLNDMGPAYALLGQKQKALESYNKALTMWREIGNRQGEAATLDNMGWLYRDLGQHQTALDHYNQALPIWREVGNRSGEARALSDMGRAYADLHQPAKALEFAREALPIFRETGNLRGQAMTLNNMGRDQFDLGEAKQALDLDLQALALWRQAADKRGEALALMTIAWSYSALKDPDASLASALAALGLAKAIGDPETEGLVEDSIMLGFRKQQRPAEAIFFGLLAVNSYEQIRKNISGLDKEIQAGFAQSKAESYRTLAELLIEAGRLGQAEQILDLVKEQEFKDLISSGAPTSASKVGLLQLSPAQQQAVSDLPDLETKAQALENANLAFTELQNKASRTPAEETQLNTLNASVQQLKGDIQSGVTNKLFHALESQSTPGPATADTSKSLLQDSLAKLGPHVMGIRLLLGDDHAYAIVITSNNRKLIVLKSTSADLRREALDALKALSSPASDPRPQLANLYASIFAPLADHIKNIDSAPEPQDYFTTILWSLDDAIRYVPMSALYDGTHYLVERFHNVLFTPESYGNIADSPMHSRQPLSALAMGLSKSYGGLPALPGVIPELDSVVRDPSVADSHGPIQGKLLTDEQFTLAALKDELGAGKSISVVHIASHFVLIAGSGDEPFLMMGGENTGSPSGFAWNLTEMENSPIAFHGTRLLTLSACSTAKDYTSRNGFEMDSLGMVAQQKDAEAVLATLWDVNDLSTSRIMSDFYGRWVKNPELGKAEALRQSQLAFIHGDAFAAGGGSGRGFEAVGQPEQTNGSLGYSHPYYWAPFVLIGNYQ